MDHPLRVIVTGSAGFIGFHLCRLLLGSGHPVLGFDGMTPYYDVTLKRRRHAILAGQPGFAAVEALLEDASAFDRAADAFRPDVIVHLAAQAGVRYSLTDPAAYLRANIDGTFAVLETSRRLSVGHLLMASTSSVYGGNTRLPFVETDPTDHPMSAYAATKRAAESLSHAYAHLHGIPTTLFRFFTVYGPWGRPDMALFRFTAAILRGEEIALYNHGDMRRDFTYVADLVGAVARLIVIPPQLGAAVEGDSLSPVAPWRVVNIGNGAPVSLTDFVAAVEAATGRTARRQFLPMQPGDVPATWADCALLERLTGPMPRTPLDRGVRAFVDWYRTEYAPPNAAGP